jgi:hypothetical protein
MFVVMLSALLACPAAAQQASGPESAQQGTALSADEFRTVRDRIIEQARRTKSLFVSFEVVQGNSTRKNQYRCEWAYSGEKVYRKSWWPSPVGASPSKRWGIAVWDGKVLRGYDSQSDSGSVWGKNDPDSDQPALYSEYSQLIGTYTDGTLAELVAKVPPDQWVARWSTVGTLVVLSSNNIPVWGESQQYVFTVDLGKGALVTQMDIKLMDETGAFKPIVSYKITDAREIEPGLWLPTKAAKHAELERPDSPNKEISDKELTVIDLKVNDPSTEALFDFRLPDGALYYDLILGKSMVAGAAKSAEEMGKSLDNMVADMKSTAQGEKPAPQSAPGADIALADRLTATDGRARLLWICAGSLCVLVALALILAAARGRRRSSPAIRQDEGA